MQPQVPPASMLAHHLAVMRHSHHVPCWPQRYRVLSRPEREESRPLLSVTDLPLLRHPVFVRPTPGQWCVNEQQKLCSLSTTSAEPSRCLAAHSWVGQTHGSASFKRERKQNANGKEVSDGVFIFRFSCLNRLRPSHDQGYCRQKPCGR